MPPARIAIGMGLVLLGLYLLARDAAQLNVSAHDAMAHGVEWEGPSEPGKCFFLGMLMLAIGGTLIGDVT